MQDFNKSYDSLAASAKEILKGNTSEDDKGLYQQFEAEETLNILIDEAIELNEDELKALLKDAGISLLRKGGKLLLKVAKGTGRLAGKALKKSTIVMLKALLKKAESVETTPKEYDLFIQNMDQAGYTPAINTIAQRDSLYKGAYSGSRNPFERGTLAYKMYDDLGS